MLPLLLLLAAAAARASVCPPDQTGLTLVHLLSATNPGDPYIDLLYRLVGSTQIELTLQTNLETSWLGIGFSETGHMLGSDVAVINRNDLGAAQVKDYAIYWTAYPLLDDSNQPTDPAPVPQLDVAQDWSLTCSMYDSTFNVTSYTIIRNLDTGDIHMDRPIVDGTMHVVYAWAADLVSNTLAYHSPSNRGNTQITFKGQGSTYSVPSDADGYMDLTVIGYKTNSLTTQYLCQGFDIGTTPRQIVAFEPLVAGYSGSVFMHHMLLHACGSSLSSSPVSLTLPGANASSCQSNPPVQTAEGQSPLMSGGCTAMAYGWAIGGSSIALPSVAGFPIGGGTATRYMIMEIHVNNPSSIVGTPLLGGIRIRTTTKFRQYNSSTLQMGDVQIQAFGHNPTYPVYSSQFSSQGNRYLTTNVTNDWYEARCPSGCTNSLKGPIYAVSSFLHMHQTGRTIYTTLSNSSGTFVVSQIQYWNFGFQIQIPVSYTIHPGDALSTHCNYDTSKYGLSPPYWGETSYNEMCMDFVTVYPAENIPKLARCGALYSQVLPPTGPPLVNVSSCGLSPTPAIIYSTSDGLISLPNTVFQPTPPTPTTSPTTTAPVTSASPTTTPKPTTTAAPTTTGAPTTTVSPTSQRPSRSPSSSPGTRRPSKSPSKSPSASPASQNPSHSPSASPLSSAPTTTNKPTRLPSSSPTYAGQTYHPSVSPTRRPSVSPTTSRPSKSPSARPSESPSAAPTTKRPSRSPSSSSPTSVSPTSASPTSAKPTTSKPTTGAPVTSSPSSVSPSSASPTFSTPAPTQNPTARPSGTTRHPSSSPTAQTAAPVVQSQTPVDQAISMGPVVAGAAAGGIVLLVALSAFAVVGRRLMVQRSNGGGAPYQVANSGVNVGDGTSNPKYAAGSGVNSKSVQELKI